MAPQKCLRGSFVMFEDFFSILGPFFKFFGRGGGRRAGFVLCGINFVIFEGILIFFGLIK